jgi:glycogen operon protein
LERRAASWNYGVEGPTDDLEIIELRERQKRNFLATLLLSQGTPMLLVGDEFGRTQQGNNNAYCQDNKVYWVDWNHDENGRRLTCFVARLAALRSQYPVLRQSRFLTGKWNEAIGVKDSTWLIPIGEEMTSEHRRNPRTRCVGLLLDRRAQTSEITRRGSEATRFLSSTRIMTSCYSPCPRSRAAAIGYAFSTPICRRTTTTPTSRCVSGLGINMT